MTGMLTTLEAKLNPQWTALIVVDMQNDYLHQDGALGRCGMDLRAGRAIVEPINRLTDAARSVGVPVIFTANWHSEQSDSGPWLESTNRRHGDGPRPGVAGTWGAEWYSGLDVRDEDTVIRKTRYDAFLRTPLEDELRSRGVRSLVICGTTTNVCVESTARAAHMRDYYVVVVGDCCAAPDENQHVTSLAGIDYYFGAVAELADVLGVWAPRSAVSGGR